MALGARPGFHQGVCVRVRFSLAARFCLSSVKFRSWGVLAGPHSRLLAVDQSLCFGVA